MTLEETIPSRKWWAKEKLYVEVRMYGEAYLEGTVEEVLQHLLLTDEEVYGEDDDAR